ncbi:hypothetical protein OKW43_006817 [Paraburkholderia sp. WC7.3g]
MTINCHVTLISYQTFFAPYAERLCLSEQARAPYVYNRCVRPRETRKLRQLHATSLRLRNEMPQRRALCIGYVVMRHGFAQHHIGWVDAFSQRRAEGCLIVTTRRTASSTPGGKQVGGGQGWRESVGRTGLRVAVGATGGRAGQPMIVAAQLRRERMLPVKDRAAKFVRPTKRRGVRNIRGARRSECQCASRTRCGTA